MQSFRDPYFNTQWTLGDVPFVVILARWEKFFFCTVGGWENRRSAALAHRV